ncbi:MAG TPA: hypothetical protein VLQ91_20585, partial [Draconibacterium sp.]|nr:hypothetical protein [Draconibacterium sp.]
AQSKRGFKTGCLINAIHPNLTAYLPKSRCSSLIQFTNPNSFSSKKHPVILRSENYDHENIIGLPGIPRYFLEF